MAEPPGAVHSRGYIAATPVHDLYRNFRTLNDDRVGPLRFLAPILAVELNMLCQRCIACLAPERRLLASVYQSHTHLTQRRQRDRRRRERCRSPLAAGRAHNQPDPSWTESR